MKKISILFAFCLIGCVRTNEARVDKTLPASVPPERAYISEYCDKDACLPKGAKNIVDRGHGWMTFDLEINGRKRQFLYARTIASSGNPVPAITELSE